MSGWDLSAMVPADPRGQRVRDDNTFRRCH